MVSDEEYGLLEPLLILWVLQLATKGANAKKRRSMRQNLLLYERPMSDNGLKAVGDYKVPMTY